MASSAPRWRRQAPAWPTAADSRAVWRAAVHWTMLLLGLAAVLGALSGLLWASVVDLPTYLVHADGQATTTERGLASSFGSDAWFVILGVGVGAGLGLLAWAWFNSLGWLCAVLAVVAGLVAGLVCWQVGMWLGPGAFEERLAAAKAGDVVPIALALHAYSALLVWAMAAVTPVLLLSSLGPEDDDSEPAESSQRTEPGDDDAATVARPKQPTSSEGDGRPTS